MSHFNGVEKPGVQGLFATVHTISYLRHLMHLLSIQIALNHTKDRQKQPLFG